jgi:transcriptional regulator with XRE-family HTH domain
MNIGERIKDLRIAKGYSQIELAHLANLKPPAISQYESSARSPSNSALSELSKALGTTADYLLNGENKINDTEKDMLALFNSLSEMDKEHVLSYLKFLSMKNR